MTIAAVAWNYPAEVPDASQAPEPVLLLKPEEAAKILRLGRTKIYALVKEKRLKAVKVGNLRRFRMADLKAFIDQLDEEGVSDHTA